MKYVFVFGGDASNSGKGKLSASVGALLQSHGINVSFLKIDSYLNRNAGKMSPEEHGETYVLDDGTETDLDLGSFERFCDLVLSKKNTITGGNLMLDTIYSEDKTGYNGQSIRFDDTYKKILIDKILDASNSSVNRFIDGKTVEESPETMIVELGGSISDDESKYIINSLSYFVNTLDRNDYSVVMCEDFTNLDANWKLQVKDDSIKKLKVNSLKADIVVFKHKETMSEEDKKDMTLLCDAKYLVQSYTSDNVYDIPCYYEQSGIEQHILEQLKLQDRSKQYHLVQKFEGLTKKFNSKIKVGIVSRYDKRNEPYLAVEEALLMASKSQNHEIEIEYINYYEVEKGNFDNLKNLNGILIPGGFGNAGVDGKVAVAEYARKNNIPFMGICLGFQISVIEFARNVLNMKGATSTEFGETKYPVINMIDGIKCENTNRDIYLGSYPVNYIGVPRKEIYGDEVTTQKFRHRYALNTKYRDQLEEHGLKFYGRTDKSRIVIFKLEDHPFYVGTQYHPELHSRPGDVDKIICCFVEAMIKK